MGCSRAEYIEAVSGVANAQIDTACPNERLKLALTQALEFRKFEIEMYWKRAQYFWAFLVTIYGGYFSILASNVSDCPKREILLAFAILGYFFSIGWHMANRGSKFWQQNWEYHVDILEDYVYGPLYKMVIARTDYGKKTKGFFTPVSPYPFSVSNINCLLSGTFGLFSGILLAYQMLTFVTLPGKHYAVIYSISLIVVGVLWYVFSAYVSGDIEKKLRAEKNKTRQPVIVSRKWF